MTHGGERHLDAMAEPNLKLSDGQVILKPEASSAAHASAIIGARSLVVRLQLLLLL